VEKRRRHYIEWIEITADGVAYRKFPEPADKPGTLFEEQCDDRSMSLQRIQVKWFLVCPLL